MTSQCASWDFTLSCENENYANEEELITHLKEWCKKWVFQKEEGDSGYIHWQGRVSLIKKRTRAGLVKKFIKGGHLSPTSKGVHEKNDFSYVMKADSRVDGPWSNDTYEEPPHLTFEIVNFLKKKRHTWQESIEKICRTYSERGVDVVFDITGNRGKSTTVKYLDQAKLAKKIPCVRDLKTIMAYGYKYPNRPAYIFDMPRAGTVNKREEAELWAGIEELKNGYVFDPRYEAKDMWMEKNPRVVVFTNYLPDFKFLSVDRWNLWTINEDDELVPYTVHGISGATL